MEAYFFITYLGLAWAVGIWARRWGRNSIAWTIFAVFFLPMAAGCLAACGKAGSEVLPPPPNRPYRDTGKEITPPPLQKQTTTPKPLTKAIVSTRIKERAANGDLAAIEQIREAERFNAKL
jgi:hypothetical protein